MYCSCTTTFCPCRASLADNRPALDGWGTGSIYISTPPPELNVKDARPRRLRAARDWEQRGKRYPKHGFR